MKRRIRIASIALEDIQRAAEDIYIYGYPLLLMDLARRMDTATPRPSSHDAPVNRFAHSRLLPGPFDRRVPHPNSDCLASSAWVDLNKEPIVLSVPHTQRHYLLSLFSEWYEILGSISPQKTGTHGGHFGLVGPNWSGKLPVGRLNKGVTFTALTTGIGNGARLQVLLLGSDGHLYLIWQDVTGAWVPYLDAANTMIPLL